MQIVELNNKKWGQIGPEWDLDEVSARLATFIPRFDDYDHIVVMGELSACLIIVQWAVLAGKAVWTPTTKRESTEQAQPDGSVRKVNVFRHCRLRCLYWPDKYGHKLLLKEIIGGRCKHCGERSGDAEYCSEQCASEHERCPLCGEHHHGNYCEGA